MSTNLFRFSRVFLLFGAMLLTGYVHAQLNGIYTIDATSPASGTNFISFNSAAAALKASGVNGPVTINVVAATGPYNEQVIFDTIPGTSATNTVTINGNNNTISFTPTTSLRHIVRLNGVNFMTINQLRVFYVTTTTQFCYGIFLTGGANNNTINNCTIDMSGVTTTTAASSGAIISSGSLTTNSTVGDNANNCTFSNNTILGAAGGGAYYGIRLNGMSSALPATGNKITNNNIYDYYGYGIYILNGSDMTIRGNNIERPNKTTSASTTYGIYVDQFGQANRIEQNRIHNTHGGNNAATSTNYPIYFNSCDATPGNENIVANNLIYDINTETGTIYGLYNAGSDGVHYYYNTISLDRASSTAGATRGFYQTTVASNLVFRNNIISITRGGSGAKYGIYLGTSTTTLTSNNNDIFLGSAGSGAQNVGFHSSDQATLANWQAANGGIYDANSKAVNPGFVDIATFNFVPVNPLINGIAAPIPGITTDFTGAARNVTNPDPGAFEFNPPADDAGITAISHNTGVCPGNSDSIFVTVTNFGTAQLNNVTLNWSVNGVPQPPVVKALTLGSGLSANLKIGDMTLTGGVNYNVTAWTTLPNGITDPNKANDTAVYLGLNSALAGVYTIGAAGNFPTILAAIAEMKKQGVCGAVTFNVNAASGPYSGQVEITGIAGSGATSPITFNGNNAVITANPTSTDRYVVRLNAITHVTLNNFTIIGTNATYGYGVLLSNAANNNTINGCTIDLSAITSTTNTNSGGIISNPNANTNSDPGQSASNCIFSNNTILGAAGGGAYYGIRLNGSSTVANQSTNNQLINNTVNDFYSHGIYLYYNSNTIISGNEIQRPARTSAASSLYMIYFDGSGESNRVLKNRIHNTNGGGTTSSSSNYAVYFSSCDATAGNENIVANNLIYDFNNDAGLIYALYNSGSDGVHYYFNTIVLGRTSATTGATRGFYQTTAASNLIFRNNIISITRGGSGTKHCIYLNTTTTTLTSNNNVFHLNSSGTGAQSIGNYSGDQATLANWQAANGGIYDQNSRALNPAFTEPASFNYIPQNPAINGIAVPVASITTDFTGTTRNVTNPDPGAFEFAPANDDAGIAAVIPPLGVCAGTTDSVFVTVANNGTAQINSVVLNWTVNGVLQPSVNKTLSLASGSTVKVKLGDLLVMAGVSYNVTAWTSLPNGVTDPVNANDSATYNGIEQAMSGVYTVGTAGNFPTIIAAVDKMNKQGICGAVTFNVDSASGPYTGQVNIGIIYGSSATSPVVFNGNGAIITAAATASDRHTVRLNGAQYVTINRFKIQPSNATYGYGVLLSNKADYNTINNCIIDLSAVTSTTAANSAGIVSSGSASSNDVAGDNANYCTFSNNTIFGGSTGAYYGIRLNGSGAAGAVGNQIIDNVIRDIYFYNIYLLDAQNTTVRNNNISRETKTTVSTFYGVYMSGLCESNRIERNRIHNTHDAASSLTGAAYAFYFTSADAGAGKENIVANNLVYNFNGTGTVYGVYNSGSDGAHYYFNTFSFDHTAATAGTLRGFYQLTTASNIVFKNNIISISRGGADEKYAYYLAAPASDIAMSNNAVRLASANTASLKLGFWNGISINSMDEWKLINGGVYGQNSVQTNPNFASIPGNNYIPSNALLNNKALVIASITNDFTGAPRSATPDMGAYEFSAINNNDAGISGIVHPVSPCPGTDSVVAMLTNFGANTLNNVTINWSVNGTPLLPVAYNTPLASGQSVSVTLGYVTITAGASYNVSFWTSNPNGVADPVTSNDSVKFDNIPAALNGTYTIGAAGNYTSIVAAVNDLNVKGVCGPVTFNIDPASGPYKGRIEILKIRGSSAFNTVTFNGNGATITDTTVSADRHIVRLRGATYVTIDSLHITTTGPSYAFGVQLMEAADYNTISNCFIELTTVTSTTATQSIGIVSTGSATSNATDGYAASHCVFVNNTITGGSANPGIYYGIRLNGNDGRNDNDGNMIINNTIMDTYGYGIYLDEGSNTIISGNDISRPGKLATLSTSYGIYVTAGTGKNLIEKNRIHNSHDAHTSLTGTYYPIYFSAANPAAGSENIVANNLIYNMNSDGTCYALYNTLSSNVHYYYNTISLDHAPATAGATRGFYQTGTSSGIVIRNNLFSITRGGSGAKYGLYFGTNTSSITSNNNDIYVASAGTGTQNIGYWDGTDYAGIFNWRTANSNAFDQNSLIGDPIFTNLPGNNYKPTNPLINNYAAVISAISADFTDRPRSATPDFGAYEFGDIPANDDCSMAFNVATDTIYGTTYDATLDLTPTCGSPNVSAGVWYKFLGTGEFVTLSTCGGATFNTKLSVFSGSCGALTCVVNNDDFCGAQSSVDFCATDGIDYYILVNSATVDEEGDFRLVFDRTALDPAVISFTGNTTFCADDSIVLNSNTALHYQWSSGALDTSSSVVIRSSGSYTVQTTDSRGCIDVSDPVTITVHDLPVVNIGNDTTICINQAITLNGGNSFSSYNWSTGATTPSITIEASVIGAGAHTISLSVEDGNGCGNTDEMTLIVDVCEGVEEYGNNSNFGLYPNPSNGIVRVTIDAEQGEEVFIHVTDINGRTITENRMSGNQTVIDLSNQPKGVYVVKAYSDRRTELKKLILQ